MAAEDSGASSGNEIPFEDDFAHVGHVATRRGRQEFSADGTESISLSRALRECRNYRARGARRSRTLHDVVVDADGAFRDPSDGEMVEEDAEDWFAGAHDFATRGARGMSWNDMLALPSRVLSSSEDFSNMPLCVVCQETFDAGEHVMQLACSHTFHKDCLEQWLVVTAKCPTCKQVVEPTSQ